MCRRGNCASSPMPAAGARRSRPIFPLSGSPAIPRSTSISGSASWGPPIFRPRSCAGGRRSSRRSPRRPTRRRRSGGTASRRCISTRPPRRPGSSPKSLAGPRWRARRGSNPSEARAARPRVEGEREMPAARLKHFGWGREDEGLTAEEDAFVMARAQARFGTALKDSASAPRLEDIELAAPRVMAPAALAFCTSEHYDRAAHTYGKSYPELARGLARDYASAPDVVAYPRNDAEVKAVLDWAGDADATVTPFGGGSSVCGGVEPRRNGHKGAVTIDLRHMGKVKEVDKTSRAALIEGGTYGPALEAQLRPHSLTLRHFPQSFEYSTLGGWIATRGGGHFATLYTHIDDFVESLRTVTPRGVIESRRLPGSGAGPSPDRMMIGSEGILGVITQAWMRLQERPTFRDGGALRFKDFFSAARAVRAISQAGLYPSNCRILDPAEAYNTGAAD